MVDQSNSVFDIWAHHVYTLIDTYLQGMIVLMHILFFPIYKES